MNNEPPKPSPDVADQHATRPAVGDTSVIAAALGASGLPFPQLPTEFGRYRIVKLLGRGAMGAVYQAMDSQLDRWVAIKIPHVSQADGAGAGAELLKRMEREARTLAQLAHPGICQIYDFGILHGIWFVALEYIEGETLKSLLERLGRRRKPTDAALIIRQLAKALVVVHEKGILHRDLKPENVMRKGNGRFVIMDFGLTGTARGPAADPGGSGSSERTVDGTILGTPAYMSPEQATGRLEEVDQRSDLYALGVMLYEMLTGELPFSGTVMEIMGRKAIQPPPSPLSVNRKLPPELAAICERMMARKPEDRFATCAEVALALKDPGGTLRTPPAGGTSPVAVESVYGRPVEFLAELQEDSATPPRRQSAPRDRARLAGQQDRSAKPGVPIGEWIRRPRSTGLAAAAVALGLAIAAFMTWGARQTPPVEAKPIASTAARRPDRSSDREPARPTPSPPANDSAAAITPPVTSAAAVVPPPLYSPLPVNEPIDLLEMVNFGDHAIQGSWRRSNAGVTCTPLWNARFLTPVAITGSYTVKCLFTRRSGFECIGLLLPVGPRSCGVFLDAWGSQLSGIDLIDAKALPQLTGTPAVLSEKSVAKVGVRSELTVTVAAAQDDQCDISAAIDGRVFARWSGSPLRLSQKAALALPNPQSVGVVVWNSVADIHSLELTLSPAGGRGFRLSDDDWKSPLMEVASEPPPEVIGKCLVYDGRKYLISETALLLPAAQAFARDLRGRLLTISSPDEYRFIQAQSRGRGVWLSGWRPPDLSAVWRDERNRPIRDFGLFAREQPDAGSRIQWKLCEWVSGTYQGWDDVQTEATDLRACIEWGEE